MVRRIGLGLAVVLLSCSVSAQVSDPERLVAEGDRLAWLRAWTKAEPLYSEAERTFTARGDERNALYTRINSLRGRLPRLPVPEVSEQLAEYLEHPLVLGDDRLRLRTLIIKGETDEDLDPALAERSWTEALTLAEKLGEAGWANRARGELGLVAFLLGDINNAVIRLGQAMKVAESMRDTASLVRWLTLFGHGYVELGRAEQSLEYYDRALKLAATVPELQFPLMAHLGKGDALVKLRRFDEAEKLLDHALTVAAGEGALGYQAELMLKKGLIAQQRGQRAEATQALNTAMDFAQRAGGNRIVAQISLELAKNHRASGRTTEATRTLRSGIDIARTMGERLLLPRLLSELADVHVSQRQYSEARGLLEEATDVLEGLLTNASSPWTRSRVIGGLNDVFIARTRLEGSQQNAAGLFAVLEQSKGRSLLELLSSKPLADVTRPTGLRAGERRIASLQSRLLRTSNRAERRRLLDEIFAAEEQFAPVSTELFLRTRSAPRKPVTLVQLQRALRRDELLLEFALAEPASFAVVATRDRARVQQLPGRAAIESAVKTLMATVRGGQDATANAGAVGQLLLRNLPELASRNRIIVSPDGELHALPFELISTGSSRPLLESHVVSYIPSGSILAALRTRRPGEGTRRAALAVATSQSGQAPQAAPSGNGSAPPTATRGIYDLETAELPELRFAEDEARVVAATFGAGSTVLTGDRGTELEFKQQPLHEYDVLHFAVHGIVSTRFPARSALVLQAGGGEDGLLQAREILTLRLAADLVTLSACETGTGAVHGQEGVASLVRPFIGAGAQAVLANLWTADDRFSLTLMREFYRQLATGTDIGQALRRAKLKMLEQFGPTAIANLWSGVLVHGDAAGPVGQGVPRTQTAGGK
jgi:CHAT domain-containing protein/tetratricopeptide (TPR) repeat protein